VNGLLRSRQAERAGLMDPAPLPVRPMLMCGQDEAQRLHLESESTKEKIRDNQEKIKLNKQLPDPAGRRCRGEGNALDWGCVPFLVVCCWWWWWWCEYDPPGLCLLMQGRCKTCAFCRCIVAGPGCESRR